MSKIMQKQYEDTIAENCRLLSRVAELEDQESRGMEATIDQMLGKELAEKWGLDEHGHKRNVQHIFCRACSAINDLEKKLEKLGWVAVEDLPPKELSKRYLVLINDGEDWLEDRWSEILGDNGSTFWGWEDSIDTDVTHYMDIDAIAVPESGVDGDDF